MIAAESSTSIARPAAEVFEFVSDVRNDPGGTPTSSKRTSPRGTYRTGLDLHRQIQTVHGPLGGDAQRREVRAAAAS